MTQGRYDGTPFEEWMMMKAFSCLCVAVTLVVSGVVSAAGALPDLAREKRMADEIVDAILDGEPEMLKDGSHEFLTIYTETEEEVAKGAVLILHGRGFHPDWTDTVQPLRVGLTAHGWNTLSIQMPVLEKRAKYNDYVWIFPDAIPRIEAAIRYLRAQGNKRVVVVAHSCGSHMAMHWIHSRGDKALASFDAYVGLGMGATDYQQPMQEPFALDKMKMPVLDLYGADDYPAVKRMAPARLKMIKVAGNPRSGQQVLPGANHYYVGKGDALVEAVAAWLKTL